MVNRTWEKTMNTRGSGTQEVSFGSFSGYIALLVALAALVAMVIHVSLAAQRPNGDHDPSALFVAGMVLLAAIMVKGLYMLQPNQSALLMLFGSYRGTDYSTGLRWANPLLNKK
jgi:regulator of protease activity HflC (stomatin/prohibitin superfamily)